MKRVGLVVLAVALVGGGLVLGRSASKPCKLDADCPERSLCVHPVAAGKEQPEGRCSTSCLSDLDCVLAGRPTESCATLAAGQGMTTLREGYKRTDAIAIPVNGIKACRRGDERVR